MGFFFFTGSQPAQPERRMAFWPGIFLFRSWPGWKGGMAWNSMDGMVGHCILFFPLPQRMIPKIDMLTIDFKATFTKGILYVQSPDMPTLTMRDPRALVVCLAHMELTPAARTGASSNHPLSDGCICHLQAILSMLRHYLLTLCPSWNAYINPARLLLLASARPPIHRTSLSCLPV